MVRALLLAGLLLNPLSCAQETSPRPRAVASGGYSNPRFTSDGEALLLQGPQRSYLLASLADGEVDPIPDPELAATAVATAPAVAFVHRDRIYVRTERGLITVGTGDRFFAPQPSPDGRRVAFVGLTSGIHVYDIATRELLELGPGTSPAWAPDSRRLAFERTGDDGREITSSDLWLWRVGELPQPLTATPEVIERRPAWSPAGDEIAFDDQRGTIYVMEVRQ